MTRRRWLAIGCAAWLLLGSGSASALVLSLVPLGPSVDPFVPFEIGLDVSGLGELVPPSLRAFTLELDFDELALELLGVAFGEELGFPCPPGDPNPACQAQASFSETGGVVSLFENSLISPISALDAVQPAAFRVATLTFQGLVGAELSLLSLIDDGDQELVLGDLSEGTLDSQPSLAVIVAPEPGTALLLGLGSAGLALRRRLHRLERRGRSEGSRGCENRPDGV